MDDIGTLFYIILFVLYFISRAFKKKKKAAKPMQQEEEVRERKSETGKKPTSFEELLRELSGDKGEEEEDDAPREQTAPREAERETFSSEREEDVRSTFERSVQAAKKASTIAERKIPTVETGRFKLFALEDEGESPPASEYLRMLQDPQDVKKAIVLKEILDRKYI